jgi:hypothetical protein
LRIRGEKPAFKAFPLFLLTEFHFMFQVTIVRLRKSTLRFYQNGSCEKPDELITVGYWSYKQLADLLPYNYLPE